METLVDQFSRKIDYLRISVTDRCNLRCLYCMPEHGISHKNPDEILTFEEIKRAVSFVTKLGVDKIRLTGGEPLIRKDFPALVGSISSISGVKDLAMTTNGLFLEKFAHSLKSAGLKRVNISLDTLKEETFKEITRGGNLKEVLSGIEAALKENIFIKINVVIVKSLNNDEVLDFVDFFARRNVIVRFIEFMPIGSSTLDKGYISCEQIKKELLKLGRLIPVNNIQGNGPAKYYRIINTPIIVGFITPLSFKFCSECNRLRLTSDGVLLPCLCSREGLDIKGLLRKGFDEEAILKFIREAVFLKPKEHIMEVPCAYTSCSCSSPGRYAMSEIGG